jgi:AraC family transcriptional regulator of arabinose operon
MESATTPGIPDGFPGQRMLVLPAPKQVEALAAPGTRALLVTDTGYFPDAQFHGRTRTVPISQAVILLCVKGRGWCETEAGRFEIRAGQAAVLLPGRPHSYAADVDDPWTLWWVHVDGRELPELLGLGNVRVDAPVRSIADMYATVSLVKEILSWMERDTTPSSMLAATGAAWHLLALLASDRTSSSSASDAVERAASYLRDHINQRANVDELARMAGVSPSHFAALFKKQTGYPVLHYQTQLRMGSAREMLDVTDRPIEEIARAVGYPDSFYFARQFKKLHGTSPSAYRKRHAG